MHIRSTIAQHKLNNYQQNEMSENISMFHVRIRWGKNDAGPSIMNMYVFIGLTLRNMRVFRLNRFQTNRNMRIAQKEIIHVMMRNSGAKCKLQSEWQDAK